MSVECERDRSASDFCLRNDLARLHHGKPLRGDMTFKRYPGDKLS